MPSERLTNTGIALPRTQHALLRRVVRHRQDTLGGRASVSALISELVAVHESELKAELVSRGACQVLNAARRVTAASK